MVQESHPLWKNEKTLTEAEAMQKKALIGSITAKIYEVNKRKCDVNFFF